MKDQLLATLENSRNYTLAVAEAMPETTYNFRPQGGGWNFKELLHHIAYGIHWWEKNYINKQETPWEQPPVKSSKIEVIQFLNTTYDSLKTTVANNTLKNDAVQGFHATLDHITHHRGQAVTYLRCNGITPPEYTY